MPVSQGNMADVRNICHDSGVPPRVALLVAFLRFPDAIHLLVSGICVQELIGRILQTDPGPAAQQTVKKPGLA